MSENDSKEIDDFVAHQLRALRKQNGVPLRKMAKVANVSYTTVQKYESGEVRVSVKVLHEFSKLFSVNINAFFPSNQSIGPSISIAEKELLDVFSDLRRETKTKEAILRYFSDSDT